MRIQRILFQVAVLLLAYDEPTPYYLNLALAYHHRASHHSLRRYRYFVCHKKLQTRIFL